MRTALRASIATAVLAGALLAPTGTAFATAAPQSAAAAPGAAADRYTGTPVYIGEGLVAVLRNGAEGPEAWIRAVGKDWKPGDVHMVRVMTVLDRSHLSGTVNGLDLELVGAKTAAPVLKVTATASGTTTSHPLPKSSAGGGQGAECVSTTVRLGVGGTLLADLTTTPAGPQVQLVDGVTHGAYKKLTRTNPTLAAGDRTVARILNASSAEPLFEYATPGGQYAFETAAFPALPKGCRFDHALTKGTEAPQPNGPLTKPSAAPSAKPSAAAPAAPAVPAATTAAPAVPAAAAPRAQTAGQTSVIPRGGVAAGAEIAAEEGVGSAAAASAGGLLAVLAGLGTAFALRRRARTQG
ncbi:hypothetical protein [Streptomyces sp. NPDC058674]|uniref:hypothetical protein n=1 Tax=Streptomyces sp. NPDC058674 TaxID=3346592 RepID=UPI00365AFCCF